MTACGGNFIGGEINRNKQSPQCGVAPIEVAERSILPKGDEALTTACGGNFVRAEISRNKQCPHEADLRRLRLRTMRMRITFHLWKYTVTIIIRETQRKKNSRHSDK